MGGYDELTFTPLEGIKGREDLYILRVNVDEC
jgi:hypothetical protein